MLNKQARATARPVAEILAKRQRLEALVDADGDEEDSESSNEDDEEVLLHTTIHAKSTHTFAAYEEILLSIELTPAVGPR